MYLSGPLKGAPLSLAAITPALAGPYDYGVVVVGRRTPAGLTTEPISLPNPLPTKTAPGTFS